MIGSYCYIKRRDPAKVSPFSVKRGEPKAKNQHPVEQKRAEKQDFPRESGKNEEKKPCFMSEL